MGSGFNYPNGLDKRLLGNYVLDYRISISNVDVVQLPIGSRPTASWDADTGVLTFGIANNSQGLEGLVPYATEIGVVGTNIDDVNEIAEWLQDDRIVFVDQEYEATQGQVDFDFSYSETTTLKMEVFYNGRLLSAVDGEDWIATNGTTVSLTQPVDLDGDIIYIRSWHRIKIADAVTESEVENITEGEIIDNTGTISDFENNL